MSSFVSEVKHQAAVAAGRDVIFKLQFKSVEHVGRDEVTGVLRVLRSHCAMRYPPADGLFSGGERVDVRGICGRKIHSNGARQRQFGLKNNFYGAIFKFCHDVRNYSNKVCGGGRVFVTPTGASTVSSKHN